LRPSRGNFKKPYGNKKRNRKEAKYLEVDSSVSVGVSLDGLELKNLYDDLEMERPSKLLQR